MTAAPVTDTEHLSSVLDDLIDTGLALDAAHRALATVEPLLRDAHEMLRNALTCDCGHPDSHITAAAEMLDTALVTTMTERLARS